MTLPQRFRGLRYRLLALVLIPLILLSGSVILLAFNWSSNFTYQQLFTKVNTDLRVAHDSVVRIETQTEDQLDWLANSASLQQNLSSNRVDALVTLLEQRRLQSGFSFLKLWSADARRVLHSARGWQPAEFRESALSAGILTGNRSLRAVDSAVSGIELYSQEQWRAEPGVKADDVVLPLVATARSAPTDRLVEDRAMIIRTLQPVLNNEGEAVALLEAGLLLNSNFDFVDQIRDLVYGPGSLAPGSRGTVTVFLDDVRISTNVPTLDDERALGTRVSQEVRDAVLGRGEFWIDRAFVVNDWYISAYEPIVDVNGDRVGMLYAGYLEAPFRRQLLAAITVLSAVVLAGSLLAGLAAIVGARSIFRPVETITAVVRDTAQGKYRRIGPILTGDEISELASQFDAMLDKLESHRRRIEHDASLLEQKVHDRTEELEKQNQRLQESISLLQQTRQRLATAEKLAALGELTAGVAHEINNPTAVILGNIDVLSADLGDARVSVQTEIDLIIEQVYRIRSITERLLKYSRTTDEGALNMGVSIPVDLQPFISDTLKLMAHQYDRQGVRLQLNHQAKRGPLIDAHELQQVLINLLSNAIESVAQTVEPAEIFLLTSDQENGYVQITVQDTGCGIAAEHLHRVFDPFFTHGKTGGTGLGLSVSYGIVRRYGGQIHVASQAGQGSEFTIELPGAPLVTTDSRVPG